MTPLTLTVELTEDQLDAVADRVAALLADRQPPQQSGGWLNAAEAAAHLACSRERLYDLVQLGKLARTRDGRRLLFRRSDLDQYLAS
jgi:excisionase family DNA binding protein